jgi:hypothetical protein
VPVFDEENLVSLAGLVPVMGLAERAGLSGLIASKVAINPAATRVASAGANPAGKLTSIIAGMAAGAECIDELDVIRSGGMGRLFGGVYACATLGQLLREFTHGHSLQLASVARAHLVNLIQHSELLPGLGQRVFVDIDSLLRPAFGHAKQGAGYGHTKIAGPLAHHPSGSFAANAAWAICAAITHNLLRAAGTLTSDRHAVARGATLRRQLVTVPARLARPQRRRVLHLPAHWPWANHWIDLWHNVFPTAPGPPALA